MILWIATKSLSNILWVTNLGFDVRFKLPFSLFRSLTWTLFLEFSLFYHIQDGLLIYRMLFYHCRHVFSVCIIFCVLNSMYDFSHFDWWNSNTRCTFSFLVQILNKVASFCNDARTFLCRRIQRLVFSTWPIEILQLSAIFSW